MMEMYSQSASVINEVQFILLSIGWNSHDTLWKHTLSVGSFEYL